MQDTNEHKTMVTIFPVSSSTAVTGVFVDVSAFEHVMAIYTVGDIAATGTITGAKLQQGTKQDGSGTNTDVSGAAFANLTASDDNNLQYGVLATRKLTQKWLRGVCTPATAASVVSMTFVGFNARYKPAVPTSAMAFLLV